MPLVRLKPLLEHAKKNKYAIGSFNIFNIESLEGSIEAALELKTPLICAVYEQHLQYSDLEAFSNLVKEKANKVNVPIVLHLDHIEQMSSVEKAIKYGFTSLMFDGPADMDFDEKIKKTREAVKMAHVADITVEAELDYIVRAGIDEKTKKTTDPDMAREFVESTGIDILAPAIGSVHGLNNQTATIDLNLLKEIKAKTSCYLSLHGGSGVADNILREAIDLGLNKMSVYQRLSNLSVQRMKEMIDANKAFPDLPLVMNEVRKSYREVVKDRLTVIRSKNICL